MQTKEQSASATALTDARMGRLGVELLTKATLCAVAVALLAGAVAALLGS